MTTLSGLLTERPEITELHQRPKETWRHFNPDLQNGNKIFFFIINKHVTSSVNLSLCLLSLFQGGSKPASSTKR